MNTTREPSPLLRQFPTWARNLIPVLLCLFVLSSCLGIGPSPNQPQATDLLISPSPTEPVDTQVVSNYETPIPTEIPLLSPTPYIPLATPEFSIPPQESETRVPWRPPVYPVPWIPSPNDHFYFASPIAGYDIESGYSSYGYGGVFFKNVVHTGIDLPGDIGTPILAAGSGTVVYAGQGIYRQGYDVLDDPYGKAVAIEHDFSYQGEPLFTLYAHLDEIQVKRGDYVNTGDQIGLMGETGKTTGPHLHFEVRLGKNEYFSTRNPDLWISPPQGWGVLVGQVHTYVGYPLERQIVYLYPTEDNPVIAPVNNVAWIATSYQNDAINSDPFYRENFTLANLPAGKYYVYIPATSIGLTYSKEIEIKPGQVTFFRFNLWSGFSEPKLSPSENNFSPSP